MTGNIITVDETASTNTLLSSMAAECSHGTVVRAVAQTAGRGQRGNSWEAQPGKNLTFSLLLTRPDVDASEQFIISQMVALGVADTLSTLLPGHKVEIKWPNDIYVGDRKICGILIECTLSGRRVNRAVCGIGINVNQRDFLSDAPNPVSLRQLTGVDTPLEPLLAYTVSRILALAATPREDWGDLRSRYFSQMYRRGGVYPFRDTATGRDFLARIVSVASSGHITLLDTATETARTFAFKEVAYII